MKNNITLGLLLSIFSISLFAQNSNALPIDEETGLITYQEVVEEEGTKKEYFNRAIGCSTGLF